MKKEGGRDQDEIRGKKSRSPLRFRIVIFLLGGFLFLLFLSIGIFFYSSHPSFCNLCHVMTPYYEAWRTSSHSQVPCVKCHIPPQPREAIWAKFQTINSVVHYITKRYGTKPHAEIEDASCLRKGCHETRLLKGKVTYKRDIVFDHRPHLEEWKRGKRLRCTSCHSQIVIGSHMEVTDSTCFLCHFKGTKEGRRLTPVGGCPLCHKYPKGEVVVDGVIFNHKDFVESRNVACEKCHRDVIQGEGEAPVDRCFNCHNQPERIARYDDTKFMHEVHVTEHKVDCLHCHHEIKHKIIPVKMRHQVQRCEICHSNTHLLTEKIMRGEGGRGAPPTPSHMFLARLDCASCHSFARESPIAPGGGMTMTGSEKACASCHEKKWEGMLGDWKTTLNRMVQDLEAKLAISKDRIKNMSGDSPKMSKIRSFIEDASFNIDYVKRARGIHNPFYASELLVVANNFIDKALKEIGARPPELPGDSPVRGTYCALLCHKRAGVETPENVKFLKREFPHRRHAFELDLGCTKCHSSEKHKVISHNDVLKTCLECHDKADLKVASK